MLGFEPVEQAQGIKRLKFPTTIRLEPLFLHGKLPELQRFDSCPGFRSVGIHSDSIAVVPEGLPNGIANLTSSLGHDCFRSLAQCTLRLGDSDRRQIDVSLHSQPAITSGSYLPELVDGGVELALRSGGAAAVKRNPQVVRLGFLRFDKGLFRSGEVAFGKVRQARLNLVIGVGVRHGLGLVGGRQGQGARQRYSDPLGQLVSLRAPCMFEVNYDRRAERSVEIYGPARRIVSGNRSLTLHCVCQRRGVFSEAFDGAIGKQMAHRRAATTAEGVDLTLTSMLDVVFNILAFFVATYSPPSPERNFDVSLPPPKVGAGPADLSQPQDLPTDIEQSPFQDLTVTVTALGNGDVKGIQLEMRPIAGGFDSLAREMRATMVAMGNAPGQKLEAATIVADPGLKYRHLVAAIDACYQAGIQKVNFGQALP